MFWIIATAVYFGVGHVVYVVAGAEKEMDKAFVKYGSPFDLFPRVERPARGLLRFLWLAAWPGISGTKVHGWLKRKSAGEARGEG